MSNEELVTRIQAGERDLLPTLWEQVERFIAQQARRRARALDSTAGVDADDLYQSGYLALLDAVEGYDVEAGQSFIGYLCFYLRREFRRATGCYTSKRDPLDRATSLDAPIETEDGEVSRLDTIADPLDHYEDTEDKVWQGQLRAALDKALDTLPSDQSEAVRRWYYHGHTLDDIAADAGVSPERIRQRKAKALRTLRTPCKAYLSLRQFVEERTNYYRHVGVTAFHATHTSAVELEVIKRERLAAGYFPTLAR